MYIYLHISLCFLPSLCDSGDSSLPLPAGRVQALAVICVMNVLSCVAERSRRGQAQRNVPSYLCNGEDEPCLRAFVITPHRRYCINAPDPTHPTPAATLRDEPSCLWAISGTSNTGFRREVSFPHQKKNRLMQQRMCLYLLLARGENGSECCMIKSLFVLQSFVCLSLAVNLDH